MAIARAKNAAKNAAEVKAKGAMTTAQSAGGPRAVMKPAPTCIPKKPPGPFFASPYRSEDDESPERTVMSPSAPVLSDGNLPPGRM
eukprot:944714-Amphidinium_carterae.1